MSVPPARRIRRAARLLVLDPQDRLLLFRFTVSGRAPFWAAVGGECDPDEPFEQAARRELFEETGLTADPGKQFASRSYDFTSLEGEAVTADERFFKVRVAAATISTVGHTALERDVIEQHRWFTRDELAAWPERIFPTDVLELLALADSLN